MDSSENQVFLGDLQGHKLKLAPEYEVCVCVCVTQPPIYLNIVPLQKSPQLMEIGSSDMFSTSDQPMQAT